jgi:hypothetical protein
VIFFHALGFTPKYRNCLHRRPSGTLKSTPYRDADQFSVAKRRNLVDNTPSRAVEGALVRARPLALR